MDKSAEAFRTISEAAEELDLPQHVLRFWETRFPQIKPMKRAGGRRYYRPQDLELLHAIKHLLYAEGFTIKGVQKILKEQGTHSLAAAGHAVREGPAELAEQNTLISSPARFSPEFAPGLDVRDPRAHDFLHAPEQAAEAEGNSIARDALPLASAETVPPIILSMREIEKLKVVLAELADCIQILDAAR